MPLTGKRLTIAKGIYRNGPTGTYEVRAIVGGTPYSDTMPADSTLDELKTCRARLEARGRTETPRGERHTLRLDARRYLRLIQHLATVDDREDHLNTWCELYGELHRHRLTAAHVLTARARWTRAGNAPRTINHRCDTLRHLYHTLDGRTAPTPCDTVPHLPVPKTVICRVSDAVILGVDARLQEREAAGILPDAKTRARFRVFVSTGKRPIEIMRAEPGDVNLEARVWVPRDAKGGYCPGVYLNGDQFTAWQLFIEAKAWGRFNHGAFARSIRAAGWPQDIRPYQARHSMWIEALERGVPLEDVAAGAGHRDMRLTQRVYTGIRNSRLQRLSETMDGRFQGWPVVPIRGAAGSPSSDGGSE